jgi:DNA-binding beta-propeller fold protein YncE
MKTNIKTVSLRLAAIVGLLLGGLTAPCYADILYVANTGNNTIVKFTSGGVASVFANSGLDNPVGLAFDSAGNLYVANAGNSNTIMKFTPSGGKVSATPVPPL